MSIDPTRGVPEPEYEGHAKSFVVEHRYPMPRDPGAHPRLHATRTRLVSYGPQRRNPFGGPRRQTATIELSFPEALPAHRPYFYELEHGPSISERVIDRLRLYVDRDVVVQFPRGTAPHQVRTTPRARGLWGTWFDIAVPDTGRLLPGTERRYLTDSVHVYIHRNQNLAAIPQSRDDTRSTMTPTLRHGPLRASSAPAPRARSVVQRMRRGVCEYHTTGDGGAELVLLRQTVTRIGTATGAGDQPGPAHRLGVVRVRYWNPEQRGKYHVQFGQSRGDGDLVVTITLSRNTYASFGVYGAGETLITLARGQSLLERARAEFDGNGVQLRFIESDTVPRPHDRQSRTGRPWHDYVAGDLSRRLSARRDLEFDLLYDILSTGAGFIPLIGDAFDVGHLVYALLTGEDFVGREISTTELLVMGLAVLPSVPNLGGLTLRARDQLDGARRLAASFPGGIDALRRIVHLRSAGRSSSDRARIAIASRMFRDLELTDLLRR